MNSKSNFQIYKASFNGNIVWKEKYHQPEEEPEEEPEEDREELEADERMADNSGVDLSEMPRKYFLIKC